MARLDDILDRMLARRADRLTLRVGFVPTVHATEQSVPAGRTPLSEEDWFLLMGEIVSVDDFDRIKRREACEVEYRGFEGRVTFTPEPRCELRTRRVDPTAADRLAPSGLEVVDVPRLPPRVPSMRPVSEFASLRPAAPSATSTIGASAEGSTEESGRRRIVVLGLVFLVAVVGLWLWFRPTKVPDLVVADSEGHALHLADLYQQHDKLLLVFIVPGDELSPFAIGAVKEQYAAKSAFLGVAGLYVGKQADAERFRTDRDVPFPIYGLKETPDPFALQDFIKKVGIDANHVYGGTTLLLDDRQRVVFRLELEEVRKLHDKLADISE